MRTSRRWRAAGWAALVTVLVCASLPMWTLLYLNDWEGLGKLRPLWVVLWEVSEPDPPPGVWPIQRGRYGEPTIVTAVSALIVGAVGFARASRGQHRRNHAEDAP